MAINVTNHYEYKLGPIEKVTVEVLNERYGRVSARRLHAKREYSIELATLQPEPQESTYIAWKWLGASGAMLLAMIGFIAYLKSSSSELSLLTKGGVIAALLALTALSFYLFMLISKRRVVFRARFSGVHLVEIPIPISDRKRGKAFANQLSELVNKNRARVDRSHADHDLRAGELRMLRRLSEEGAIPSADYEKAKRLLLKVSV